jgi:HAD superfamily hydrolase (TIGR01509 family)
VGALKPAPEIYREALKSAGCPPGECFFTDDVEGNVTAARELGLDAVRFESEAQIREELRGRGLKV